MQSQSSPFLNQKINPVSQHAQIFIKKRNYSNISSTIVDSLTDIYDFIYKVHLDLQLHKDNTTEKLRIQERSIQSQSLLIQNAKDVQSTFTNTVNEQFENFLSKYQKQNLEIKQQCQEISDLLSIHQGETQAHFESIQRAIAQVTAENNAQHAQFGLDIGALQGSKLDSADLFKHIESMVLEELSPQRKRLQELLQISQCLAAISQHEGLRQVELRRSNEFHK